MAQLIGVDGCKAGWFAVVETTETAEFSSVVASTFAGLVSLFGRFDVLAVDIPIGLPDRGSRVCDVLARRLLGAKRGSSVFPAPIRAVLNATTYADANAIRRTTESKGMSKQAFEITGKIAEVDDYICSRKQRDCRIYEVHPEVSFMELAGQRAMHHNKKSSEGRDERHRLLSRVFPADALIATRDKHRRKHVAHDDVHDAFVSLWSARRIYEGQAKRVPAVPELDPKGLDAAIWY